MANQNLEQRVDELSEMFQYIKDNVVTHADLDKFATKDDLKQFATKEDIKELVTRNELQSDLGRLEYNLKTYIDHKTADLASEIGDRLNRHSAVDMTLHQETLNILEDNKLATPPQLAKMKELLH